MYVNRDQCSKVDFVTPDLSITPAAACVGTHQGFSGLNAVTGAAFHLSSSAERCSEDSEA